MCSEARVCSEVTEKAPDEIQPFENFTVFHTPTIAYEST